MKKTYFILAMILLIVSCTSNGQIANKNDDRLIRVVNYDKTDIKNSDAHTLFNKGLDATKAHDFLKAKGFYEESDKLEPNNVIILNSLGLTAFELQDYDKAFEIFQKTLNLDSLFFDTYVNFGHCLNANGQYEKALIIMEKGKILSASDFGKGTLFFNIAVSHYRLNECKKAIQYANDARNLINSDEYSKMINSFINEVNSYCKK